MALVMAKSLYHFASLHMYINTSLLGKLFCLEG